MAKEIVKKAPSKARTIIVEAAKKARRGVSRAAKEREGLKDVAIAGAMGYALGYAKEGKMLDNLPLAKSMGAEESVAVLSAAAYFFTGNKWAQGAAETSLAIVGYKRARNAKNAAGRAPGASPVIAGEMGAEEEVGAVEILD